MAKVATKQRKGIAKGAKQAYLKDGDEDMAPKTVKEIDDAVTNYLELREEAAQVADDLEEARATITEALKKHGVSGEYRVLIGEVLYSASLEERERVSIKKAKKPEDKAAE